MTSEDFSGPSEETVKQVIRLIGNTCWNFRKPESREDLESLVRVWRRALSRVVVPQCVYVEAVESWLASASAGAPPPYPGDILRHCGIVMAQVERDPARRVKLAEWRERRDRAKCP